MSVDVTRRTVLAFAAAAYAPVSWSQAAVGTLAQIKLLGTLAGISISFISMAGTSPRRSSSTERRS